MNIRAWEDAELRTMPLARIRACQDLVRQQQRMAYQQGNTHALKQLHEWDERYAQEVMRRLDEGLV